MRDYGIVSPRFWIGETGKLLRKDKDSQLIALYLMTSPHSNMIGVYQCPITYIAEETGTPFKGASKALRRLLEVGFCERDERLDTIFVKTMVEWQIGSTLDIKDNRVKSMKREVENIISARLKQRFLEVHGLRYHLVSKEWKPSPLEAPPEPLRSQDQDQDQEQDQKQEQDHTQEAPLKFHESLPRANWEEWIVHRRHKKWPVDPTTLGKQLKLLARLSTEDQIDSIDKSINAGWQGLFEPKRQNGSGHKTKYTQAMEALNRA